MVDHLKKLFPKLVDDNSRVTSDWDPAYNCIAWAAGVFTQRWWPTKDVDDGYWPATAPRSETLAAFHDMFQSLGYAVCALDELEVGVEKIAVFASADGLPTHAARQLPNGCWTSKLGKAEDIEHDLHDLEGDLYGRVVLVMRRSVSHDHVI